MVTGHVTGRVCGHWSCDNMSYLFLYNNLLDEWLQLQVYYVAILSVMGYYTLNCKCTCS